MNDTSATNLKKWTNICLSHLAEEETTLHETLNALFDVRSALVHGNRDALPAALALQEKAARSAQTIHEKRGRVRAVMAKCLQVPASSVTLRFFAKWVGGEVEHQMLDYHRRLTRLAAEVQRIHQANTSLILQSIEILERLLLQLTGDEVDGRYSPSGVVDSQRQGSMIQARC